MKKIKGKLIGVITILVLCISACTSMDKESAMKIREERIQKAHGEDWKVHSETQIGEFVFSAAYSQEEIGIKVFPPSENKDGRPTLATPFYFTEANCISQEFRYDGIYYYLFWTNRSDVDYAEITYTVDGEKQEPIRYDAKEIFYSQVPCGDYSYEMIYYDTNGNAITDIPHTKIDYLNQRVMIDGKIYESTGKISDKKHNATADGKISSSVFFKESPVKDDQSNFGVKGMYGEEHHYYIIDDNTVEIFMDENWVIFEII